MFVSRVEALDHVQSTWSTQVAAVDGGKDVRQCRFGHGYPPERKRGHASLSLVSIVCLRRHASRVLNYSRVSVAFLLIFVLFFIFLVLKFGSFKSTPVRDIKEVPFSVARATLGSSFMSFEVVVSCGWSRPCCVQAICTERSGINACQFNCKM
jgi:hypothetical protein